MSTLPGAVDDARYTAPSVLIENPANRSLLESTSAGVNGINRKLTPRIATSVKFTVICCTRQWQLLQWILFPANEPGVIHDSSRRDPVLPVVALFVIDAWYRVTTRDQGTHVISL